MPKHQRLSWPPILDEARRIVAEYEQRITLRQLFYRLVSAELIPNTDSAVTRLSKLTAEGRRAGTFPRLVDRTRRILQSPSWDDAAAAREALAEQFRLDRTEGQEYLVVLGVEKDALATMLFDAFDEYGLPVVALRGFDSQSHVDEVLDMLTEDGRPAVLVYGGDFDPSGKDIIRDFVARTEGAWKDVHHVALTEQQIEEYQLPRLPGKASDSRAAGFVLEHGSLFQVELDALPPEAFIAAYRDVIDQYVDVSTLEATISREDAERDLLT